MGDELTFLRFFYQEARKGMGPADADIYDMIHEDYEAATGNRVPRDYRRDED